MMQLSTAFFPLPWPSAVLPEGLIMKRKIKLDELHKVEASSVIPLAHNASDVVQAIIKVKETNYIPKYVRLRASIGPNIFTGEFKYDDLESLQEDPKVESVSISKELKSVE
jgi:hypothetical protein